MLFRFQNRTKLYSNYFLESIHFELMLNHYNSIQSKKRYKNLDFDEISKDLLMLNHWELKLSEEIDTLRF